jgi:hypothetical protein
MGRRSRPFSEGSDPDATPEAEPDATPEAEPDATPEAEPDALPHEPSGP